MARGQGVNPFGIPTNAQPMDEKGGSVTIPWRLFFTRLAQSVANLILSAVPGAPNKSIQFNDGGAFGGDANLTWDKDIRQEKVHGLTASPIVAGGAGLVALSPRSTTEDDIGLGQSVNAAGDSIPNDTSAAFIFRSGDSAGFELESNLTVGTPNLFTAGIGAAIQGPNFATDKNSLLVYEYGGLGSGPVPGLSVIAEANSSGSGAASTLGLEELSGTRKYIWFDATGAPRYGPSRPTENGSVSDTSGTLFGSGGGTVTNTYTQLFTRRGEDGRIGTPGLPGPQGATGSTGATGPAGAAGVIITRRSDEGRNGMPGLQGSNGADGATGAAGAPGAVIGRRADVGPRGVPGSIGPTGSSAPATRAITFAIDGGGSTLTTGVKADVYVPYAATITANTLLGDQSGSIVLDIKKSTYAGFPGSLTSIVASAAPTITTAQKSTDSTLTGWTTGISAGDVLEFSISSVTSLTRLNCTLTVTA